MLSAIFLMSGVPAEPWPVSHKQVPIVTYEYRRHSYCGTLAHRYCAVCRCARPCR